MPGKPQRLKEKLILMLRLCCIKLLLKHLNLKEKESKVDRLLEPNAIKQNNPCLVTNQLLAIRKVTKTERTSISIQLTIVQSISKRGGLPMKTKNVQLSLRKLKLTFVALLVMFIANISIPKDCKSQGLKAI